MTNFLGGRRLQGLSSERTNYTPVTFNNATIVNGMSATGNVISGAGVSGSWQSYIRSNEFISPSTGGGEVILTGYSYTANNENLAFGLEKTPHLQYPNDVYQTSDYGWHFTASAAGNDIYEKTSSYGITPASTSTSQVWKITMDGAGLVKYYVDNELVRTSTVTASGNYYIIAGFSSNAPNDTATITMTPKLLNDSNLQTQSRFEETDTQTIYYLTDILDVSGYVVQTNGDDDSGFDWSRNAAGWRQRFQAGHALIGKKLKAITMYLQYNTSNSSPAQNLICKHFGSTPATIRATATETPSTSTLTTSYQTYTFNFPNPQVVQADDHIMVTIQNSGGGSGGLGCDITSSALSANMNFSTWASSAGSFTEQTNRELRFSLDTATIGWWAQQ